MEGLVNLRSRAALAATTLFAAACGAAAQAPPHDTTQATPSAGHEADATSPRRARDCAQGEVNKSALALVAQDDEQRRATDGRDTSPVDWADLREGYRSLLGGCPDAPGLAPLYVKYGRLLLDVQAPEEAQPVFRSLVCHDRYPTPAPATAQHLPQDRVDEVRRRTTLGASPPPPAPPVASTDPLPPFVDPYPGDCKPLAGATPEMIAEGWYSLGEHHLTGLGDGGPFEPNRALAAYRHALAAATGDVRALALYKLGFVYVRTARYASGVKSFVALLDELEQKPVNDGDTRRTLVTDATFYIATSLGFGNFEGPPESSAGPPADDPIDVAKSTAELEKLYAVALTRLQDPAILKRDAAYAPAIYRALASDLEDHTLYGLANRTRELYLAAFPVERQIPRVVADMIHAYIASSSVLKVSSPAKSAEAGRRARAELARLRKLVKSGPWFEANRGDTEAMREAGAQLERAESDVAGRPPKPSSATGALIQIR